MALKREQVIQAAEKLVSRGKVEAAIKEYRKLLAENPNDTSTLNRLGDLYARLDRIDEAIRLFTQIADRYTEDGFFVKAIAIYKKIIKLDPRRHEFYEKLAELYHKQGLVPEARTQYQVLGDYYMKHGNLAGAVNIRLRMVALEPEDPAPHLHLAELYQQQGELDRALAEYRIIADLLLGHGRVDDATQVYLRALEIAPQDIAFITDAVLGLKDAGHVGQAARLLAAAVARNPQAEKIARLAGMGKGTRPTAPREGVPHEEGAEVEIEEAPGGFPEATPELSSQGGAAGEPAAFEMEELVLDLTDEEPPPTLVQPPPDMVARPAPPPPPEEPAEEEIELVLEELEVDLESGPPTPQAQPTAPVLGEAELPPEIEWSFEAEPDFEISFARSDLPAGETPQGPAEAAPPPPAPPQEAVPAARATVAPLELDTEQLERAAAEVAAPRVRREEDLLAEAEVFAKYGLQEKAHDRLREVLQLNPRNLAAHSLAIHLLLDEGRHDRVISRANQMSQLAAETKNLDPWKQLRQRLRKAGYRLEGERVIAAPEVVPEEKDRVARLLESLVEVAPSPRPAKRGAKPKPAKRAAKAKATEPATEERRIDEALSALRAQVLEKPVRPKVKKPEAVLPPELALPPVGKAAPAAKAAPPPAAEEAAPTAESPPAAAPPAPIPAIPSPPPPTGTAPPPLPPAGIGAAPPPAAPAEEAPASGLVSTAREAFEESGLHWLDEVVAPAPGTEPAPEKLFEDEEEFFDLAAELEQELSREEILHPGELLGAPQEQTLEEIVEGFKRGVAENLSPEDFDTHYNLGIAYREMALLDEAIGEFQLAAKHPKYLVDCCSMLGICFLEKGLPELAIKWYRRGLESPGLGEEAMLGLLYDMGNVYVAMGDREAAYKTYVEVYGVNTNYRDVVARLEELAPDRQ